MNAIQLSQTNPARFRNTILCHLATDVIERLQLTAVALPVGRLMESSGHAIQNLFFVEEGVGSLTTAYQDGSEVEAAMFGYESVIGVSALMGIKRSLNRIYMQMPGRGFSSPVAEARKEFDRGGEFHRLCLRYVQAQLTQLAQSVGCGLKHSVQQRLARMLMISADRGHTECIGFSQEFLANMLGSRRTSVALAAVHFRKKGLITYRRSDIRILDKDRLEHEACECYLVVKDHLDNYRDFDTGFVV